MGKKRVVQKGSLETQARPKAGRVGSGKVPKIDSGKVHIQATYNNTIVTIADERGNVVASSSAGALGFRGPKKATPYAATKVIESLSDMIKKMGLKKVEVYVRGIGSGRESALRSLAGLGLELTLLKDITPIPHNGPRSPKSRRV